MNIVATPKSAAITGALSATISVFLAPLIDRQPSLSVWSMLLIVIVVCLPAYFFVFGIRKRDMIGAWLFSPPLLKRMAAWVLGVFSVATVAQFLFLIIPE